MDLRFSPFPFHAAIDQGDEVLLFDPAYETYETCVELARGVPVRWLL
jgi:aspartate/methionine/tyrosine aminotransferase